MWRIARVKKQYLCSVKLKSAILVTSLVAGGAAMFAYKKKLDAEMEAREQQLNKERQEYLDEISKLEDKIDPNINAYQAPLTFTCTARFGGLTLNQLEVWLNIKNNSDQKVEIGDIRSTIAVGGYISSRVAPANIARFIIPAKSSVRVRLYARGDVAFPKDYNKVRRALAPLCGSSGTKIPNGTNIPASKEPVLMDIDYMWYGVGFEDECHVYDVPGDFDYKFATWTVGSWTGYNAYNENQQKKNPSHWTQYDGK